MPTLEFKGKPFVYSHHLSVPFRELIVDPKKSYPGGKKQRGADAQPRANNFEGGGEGEESEGRARLCPAEVHKPAGAFEARDRFLSASLCRVPHSRRGAR